MACGAYAIHAKQDGLPFAPPRYRRGEKLHLIPVDSEVERLIAAMRLRTQTFLSVLPAFREKLRACPWECSKTSLKPTVRHSEAAIDHHRTRDILHVMQLLGHKNTKNTLVYTHLVSFESDEFVCKTARTVYEARALIENGFEYVTDVDGKKLFKKRK